MKHKKNNEWMSLEDIVKSPEFIRYFNSESDLALGIDQAANYYQKLLAFKKYYEDNYGDIVGRPDKWYSSYPIDLTQIFTPIEQRAWEAIRYKGRMVLYPQFPALSYFLDFANPGLGIAVELDGKDYHNKDKDFIRDKELKNAGWTIYRITGTEMSRTNYKDLSEVQEAFADEEDENQAYADLKYWLMETGDGVLEAIRRHHFLDESGSGSDDPVLQLYFSFCHQTLEAHRS